METHCQICYQNSGGCRCFSGTKKKNTEVRPILSMVMVAIFMVGGFIHVTNWDTHAISVIGLKMKSIMGLSSGADHKAMASICLERRKYDCSETELKYALKFQGKDQELWAQLGNLQFRMGKYQDAANSLENYAKLGGTDLDARYTLARAYLAEKQSDKAINLLTRILSEKPETLQVTVTRSYVEALMQANKWSKAKQIIERTRNQSASFNLFMNAEYTAVLGKVRSLASH